MPLNVLSCDKLDRASESETRRKEGRSAHLPRRGSALRVLTPTTCFTSTIGGRCWSPTKLVLLCVSINSINTVDKGDGISSTSTVERSNESDQGWSRWVNNITNDHNDNRTRHWQHEGHMFNMWRQGYQSIQQIDFSSK